MKIAIIILTSIAWVVPGRSYHPPRTILEHSLPGNAMTAALALRKADYLAVIPVEPHYTEKERHSFN